ncbi:MAG: hypothetical protein ACSHW1_18050 [Yoonia sp.]
MTISDTDRSDEGESIFSQRRSIIWKSLSSTRILGDARHNLGP